MTIIGYGMRAPGFARGRQYLFTLSDKSISTDSIWLAATMLCHGTKRVAGKDEKEYKPGRFAGTKLGRIAKTGEQIFAFEIEGDPRDLHERRLLFHAGAYRVDPVELESRRNFLMDALSIARQEAKRLGDEERDEDGCEK